MKPKAATMKKPIEYLDQMSDDSLGAGLTKSDWLDFLIAFEDELQIKIQMVSNEVREEQKKKDANL